MSAKNNPVSRILRLLKLEKAEVSGIYFHAILNGLIQLSLPVGMAERAMLSHFYLE